MNAAAKQLVGQMRKLTMNNEHSVKEAVIQWNKRQFYRAIEQERFDDAKRYKENIERLEA